MSYNTVHPPSRRLRCVLALAVAAGSLGLLSPSPAAAYPDGEDLFYAVMDEAWQREFGTTFQYSSPTIADIDGDGRADIVLAGHDGILRVVRADGSTIWEAAVVPPGAGGPVAVDSTPTVADLDGDGRPEIVVGAGTFNVYGQHGGLVVFDSAGNVRWKWLSNDIFNVWTMSPGADGYLEPVQATTAVGDVNGDGRLDVVFGSMDNRVHVVDGGNGQEIPGWTDPQGTPGFWIDDAMWGSIAVADVDGDGRAEVFAGSAATPGGSVSHAGGVLMRLDLDGAAVNATWMRFYAEPVNSSPAVGDITGDGRPEIVVGVGNENGTADERKVIAVDSANGADAPGWPQETNGVTFSSPALGDLDGDSRLDIAIGTMPGDNNGHVYVFRGDGSVMWARTPNDPAAGEPNGVIVASPVIADINGDGRQDVTIGHGWAMYSLDGPTGNRLFAAVDKGNTYQNSPAVGDFGLGVGWLLVNASMQGRVGAYRVPAPGQAPDWPNWRGSYRHTGRPATDEPPCREAPPATGAPTVGASTFHALPPARVLDTRNGLGAERMPLGGGCTLGLKVTGAGGVPDGAAAVVLNVTAVEARGNGYLTVFPCGENPPNASNLNFIVGQTVPNAVQVPVGVGGQVCFTSLVAVDLVADVSGWYGGNQGARYQPLTPARVLDTRVGIGAAANQVVAEGTVALDVTGAGGVPASGVSAVALNVTVTEPAGAGFLTVFPCGPRPLASNLNFVAGQNVPNHVIVPVAADGTVCFSGNVSTHVLADVAGWYGAPGATEGTPFVPLAPSRILDTRDGTGIGTPARLSPGATLELTVVGRNGLPGQGVRAVTLNVTATAPAAPGFVTVFPCGEAPPNASNLNYTAGSNVPNLVTAAVGAGGKVCFTSYAATDLIADVAGYFPG